MTDDATALSSPSATEQRTACRRLVHDFMTIDPLVRSPEKDTATRALAAFIQGAAPVDVRTECLKQYFDVAYGDVRITGRYAEINGRPLTEIKIGTPYRDDVISLTRSMLLNGDVTFRLIALRAGKFYEDDSGPLVVSFAASDQSREVRIAALEALQGTSMAGDVHFGRNVSQYLTAVDQALASDDPQMIAAALPDYAIVHGQEARPRLKTYATSENSGVRFAALVGLLRITPSSRLSDEDVRFFGRYLRDSDERTRQVALSMLCLSRNRSAVASISSFAATASSAEKKYGQRCVKWLRSTQSHTL